MRCVKIENLADAMDTYDTHTHTHLANFDADVDGNNDDGDGRDENGQCLLNEHDSCWLLASEIRFVRVCRSLACTSSLFLSLVFSLPNDESPTTSQTRFYLIIR